MGRLIADKRERLADIVSAADAQEFLDYPDPNGSDAPFSYDIRVELESGGIVRVERKALRSDAVQSWLDGKLARQLSAVDLFCVEMPNVFDLAEQPLTQVEQNFLKHLEYLKLSIPVWETGGPGDTMRRLRWLADRKDGISIRPNRIEGSGSRESVQAAILRAAMAGSGHSPSRATPSGTVGAQLAALVDWPALANALRVESWDKADWAGRKPSDKTLGRIIERVLGKEVPQ